MSEEAAISAVVDAMYAMISGPAGPRDWARQAECFQPDARQMRTGVDEDGVPWIKIMALDEYRENTTPFFEANAFYEIEIARRIDVFGNMAHVWSAYEARTALMMPSRSDAGSTRSSSIATKRDAGASSA